MSKVNALPKNQCFVTPPSNMTGLEGMQVCYSRQQLIRSTVVKIIQRPSNQRFTKTLGFRCRKMQQNQRWSDPPETSTRQCSREFSRWKGRNRSKTAAGWSIHRFPTDRTPSNRQLPRPITIDWEFHDFSPSQEQRIDIRRSAHVCSIYSAYLSEYPCRLPSWDPCSSNTIRRQNLDRDYGLQSSWYGFFPNPGFFLRPIYRFSWITRQMTFYLWVI